RFISYKNTGEFLGGQRADAALELGFNDLFRASRLAVSQHLANADDGREARSERRFGLLEHGFVGIAKELTALRMADDGIAATSLDKHNSGDLAGERAFLLPVNVLAGDGDFGAFGGFDGDRNVGERRGDDDVTVADARDQRIETGEES